jgi:hypothetical protein
MVGTDPVPTVDELPFKIVKMLGHRPATIARVENLLICKALPGCPLGDAARGEDHFEVERGIALLSGSLRAPKSREPDQWHAR